MKKILFSFITVLSLLSTVINAQNAIFGCIDTAAANYDPNATQELAGPVEFPTGCNQNGWYGNYVGINLALYQSYPSEFSVGTKVTIAGQDYWIDAMNVPGNCNAGVALIYIAHSPGQADGNPWTVGGGDVINPIMPGDEWNITECFYNPGCMDPDYVEYDPNADWDDGSCQTLKVNGCIDPTSINYNPWANIDDGSCIPDLDCGFDSVQIRVTIKLDNWPGETSWYLQHYNPNQNIVDTTYHVPQGTYNYSQQGQVITTTFCAPAGPNHLLQFILQDSYGDGIKGSNPPTNSGYCLVENISCPDTIFYMSPSQADFGHLIFSDPNYWSQREAFCGGPPIFGCTDPAYQEYDSLATSDDGSCQNLHVYGCMDTNSVNYNPNHTAPDNIEHCQYRLILEDDGGDGWGDSFIGIKQGDSLWDYRLGPGTYVDTFYIDFIVEDNPGLQEPVEMYYFEIRSGQQSTQQLEIQTIQNSVKIENDYGVLLHEGNFPWANGNKLKNFQTTEDIYTAIPFCGYVCTPKIYGCTDPLAHIDSYDPDANTDDGSCFYNPGCNNQGFVEFWDADSNVVDFWDIDYCYTPAIFGCMDSTSFNYNPAANVEPAGTCVPFIYGCTDPTAYNYNANANTDDGSCEPYIFGCTDPTAFNYDSTANTDNGSCIPVVYGCTDSTALNYDPNANTDNGTCILPNPGCTDPNAYNYDPTANVTDSTACLYDAGCITGPGNPYWLNDQCYAWVISVDPYCCNVGWDSNCQNTYDYCNQNSGWVGIENLVADGGVVIYPNPTNRELNIISSRLGNTFITIYSVSGQIVVNETSESVIDISHLENGVYFINVKVGELTYIRKVIKQ
jgi:hypothetical protein